MITTLTPQDAALSGYRSLTKAYTADEQWMLDRLLADLRRGNADFTIVPVRTGNEIWIRDLIRDSRAARREAVKDVHSA